jgi:hypothetical protein
MPDFTTMPAAATNDWMSSAFSGFGVTLPDARPGDATSLTASSRKTGLTSAMAPARLTVVDGVRKPPALCVGAASASEETPAFPVAGRAVGVYFQAIGGVRTDGIHCLRRADII